MSDYIYNETGYLLDNDDVLTIDTYETYFRKYAEHFLQDYGNPELVSIEIDHNHKEFVLAYTKDAEICADCDEAGITEGRCEGHGGNKLTEELNFRIVSIFPSA